MRYIELLEGRDAPLYHGATAKIVNRILADNRLGARTKQEINKETVHGVSLTRDIRFALSWGTFALKLNQRKLSHNFKIIPYDYSDEDPDEVARRSESEEFLVGAITPLDRYLESIIVPKADWDRLIQMAKRDNEILVAIEPIEKHPLLTII